MKDGGPAFPTEQGFIEGRREWNDTWEPGMSLRDWFAGQAMKGMLSNPGLIDVFPEGRLRETLAEVAGGLADAMIADSDKAEE